MKKEVRTYDGVISDPKKNQALLITTNTQGRHGKGNAKIGLDKWGAIYGKASGPQGKCYAIITKDLTKKKHPSISKQFIIEQIEQFYKFAEKYWNIDFLVPYKGYGKNLNGYLPNEMAEMFSAFEIPNNILFEETFAKLLKI